MHDLSPEMKECIDRCLACYASCRGDAMNHCLEAGGEHTEPDHFRLMMNCAEICRTAADFMLTGSPMHTQVCAVCADVCEDCAVSCEDLEGMEDCASACRACEESCRHMAGSTRGKAGQPTLRA